MECNKHTYDNIMFMSYISYLVWLFICSKAIVNLNSHLMITDFNIFSPSPTFSLMTSPCSDRLSRCILGRTWFRYWPLTSSTNPGQGPDMSGGGGGVLTDRWPVAAGKVTPVCPQHSSAVISVWFRASAAWLTCLFNWLCQFCHRRTLQINKTSVHKKEELEYYIIS